MLSFYLLCIWLIGGVTGAGFYVGYMQREFPGRAVKDYRYDLWMGLLCGFIAGPMFTVIALSYSYPNANWTLRPPKE